MGVAASKVAMGQRISRWREERTRKAYVEESWPSNTNPGTGEIETPAVSATKRRPRRETDPNIKYKKKIRARSIDYYRGAWSEETLYQAPTEVLAGQCKRPIKYKTVPRWTRSMLEEHRNKFWEGRIKLNRSRNHAAVWEALKRFLEDQIVRQPESTTAPWIDTDTVDCKLGIVSTGGVWKRSEQTGSILYFYTFTDANDDTFAVPCFTIAAPSNQV